MEQARRLAFDLHDDIYKETHRFMNSCNWKRGLRLNIYIFIYMYRYILLGSIDFTPTRANKWLRV